jgi:hypothetical protein
VNRNPIDRSLAFTALLDQGYLKGVEFRRGEQMVTVFLNDWYLAGDQYQGTMYEFAGSWSMHDDLDIDWKRLAEAELTHDKELADTELAHIGVTDASE